MTKEFRPYKAHLFICTNRRKNGEDCASKGSEGLRDLVKKKCKDRFGKDVRVNASGCLGHCEHGIVAVSYPSGQWFLDLKAEKDVKTLEDAVEKELSDPEHSLKGHE